MDIPYAEFNQIVGCKENNIIQGFTVMDEERSAKFLDAFGFWSERYEADVPDEVYESALANLDGPLDAQVRSWVRTEQSRARKLLLGKRMVGTCRLCGREFPKEFLVAAHKKKRSQCTDAEKRDIANVTMLCCLFGCDALYEKGLVSVSGSGEILRSSRLATNTSIERAATEFLMDRIDIQPNEAQYFQWHRHNCYIS